MLGALTTYVVAKAPRGADSPMRGAFFSHAEQ
jgi:hypothetical protein